MAGKPDNPNIQGKCCPNYCTKSYTVGCTEKFSPQGSKSLKACPNSFPLTGRLSRYLAGLGFTVFRVSSAGIAAKHNGNMVRVGRAAISPVLLFSQ